MDAGPCVTAVSLVSICSHCVLTHSAVASGSDHSLRCVSWGLDCLFLPYLENLPLLWVCQQEPCGAGWEMLMFPLGIHFMNVQLKMCFTFSLILENLL